MTRIAIAPIVEGHGDNDAVRGLIQRCWTHLGGEYAEVVRPNRQKRDRLLKRDDDHLDKAVELAAAKLQGVDKVASKLILLMVDAENDCAPGRQLGPELLSRAKRVRPDFDITCVIANKMYETWFVASYESLVDRKLIEIEPNEPVTYDPEGEGLGKGWIKSHRPNGQRYSETIDQPRMTFAIDIDLCRQRCRSFDKLCREFEDRI